MKSFDHLFRDSRILDGLGLLAFPDQDKDQSDGEDRAPIMRYQRAICLPVSNNVLNIGLVWFGFWLLLEVVRLRDRRIEQRPRFWLGVNVRAAAPGSQAALQQC